MKEHIQAIIDQEKQYPQEERMLYHYNCAETLLMAADRKNAAAPARRTSAVSWPWQLP